MLPKLWTRPPVLSGPSLRDFSVPHFSKPEPEPELGGCKADAVLERDRKLREKFKDYTARAPSLRARNSPAFL